MAVKRKVPRIGIPRTPRGRAAGQQRALSVGRGRKTGLKRRVRRVRLHV